MAKVLENSRNQSNIAQRTPAIKHPMLETPLETKRSSPTHNLEIQRPSWEQLRVLRTLRAKFIVHHRQFLQRTASSCSDRVQELRKRCRRYTDLLDTGLLTFKAIINNESPSSLKEIFAFISLSYAMVGTMQAEGKPVSFCLNELEMQSWRRSLQTTKDRITFDELVPLLWPELNKYQEDPDGLALEERYYSTLDIDIDFSDVSPLRSTVERFLEESSSDENFCFEDWLSFPEADASPFTPGKFDLIASLHDPSRRSPHRDPTSDSHSHQRNTNSPSEMQHTHRGGDKTTLEQLQGLAQTVLFMQAITFLICEISRPLYQLQ